MGYETLFTDDAVLGRPIRFRALVDDGRLRIATRGTPTGGTFTLKYANEETDDIAYNASAAAVLAALAELPGILTGDLTASGGSLPTAVVIEFGGRLTGVRAGEAVELGDDSLITGGTNAAVELSLQPQDLSSYTLSFMAKSLPFDADADALFTLTEGDGITVSDATGGVLLIEISAAKQSSLTWAEGSEWYCELKGVDDANSRTFTLAQGRIVLTGPIDR